MKSKLKSIMFTALLSGVITSNAATVIITNATNGGGDPLNSVPADTLYALQDNSLMTGGIVAAGYFSAATLTSNVDTISELFALLGSFTTVTSISPGTTAVGGLGEGILAGYADQFPTSFSFGPVNTVANPLFNRDIYAIVTNASSLATATATSQFGLLYLGRLTGDLSGEVGLVANPSATTGAVIGTFGTITGDFAGSLSDPTSVFDTFQLASVPEPSAALLGALSALALFRRRRA